MIKNFNEFINESVEITTKVDLGENFELLIAARDEDDQMNYNIEIIEKNFEIDHSLKNAHLSATIYVMPDDTVEIRSVGDGGKYVYGKVVELDGDKVRNNKLHRHRWDVIFRLHRKSDI